MIMPMHAMSMSTCHSHTLERVENSGQEHELDTAQSSISKPLAAAGAEVLRGVHTRWVFHGPSDAKTLELIVDNPNRGFDVGYAVRGLWGKGSYFARDASYPVHAGFGKGCLSRKYGDNKMLFLCLVECGLPCLGELEDFMDTYPTVHPDHSLDYSTLVGSTASPEFFCTVKNHQAYPAYVIHFSRKIGH